MQKSDSISRYTAEELKEMRAAGFSQTDWAKVDALTEEELEASIDSEDEGEFDWSNVLTETPGPKQQLTVRFDADIIEWFKAQGAGYQTRMKSVLRSNVNAKKPEDARSEHG